MSTTKSTRRGVAVVRVSKVNGRKDGDGQRFRSPEEQVSVMRDLARGRRARIVETFEDLDESGGTMNRPGLNAALEMIRDGRADTLIVAKLDRFARNARGALETLELIESYGGTLICGDLDLDTSTPMGRAMFTIIAAFAELERTTKGAAFASAAEAATREGIRIAPAPIGYLTDEVTRHLVRDPERADLVTEVFERRANGQSWSTIRGWWHGETGEWLKVSAFSRMVSNRTYLGELSFAGVVSDVEHDALVEPEVFEAAQGTRSLRPPRSRKPRALLAGIIRCSGCGRPMTPSTAGRGNVTIYRCQKQSLNGTKCPAPVAITASKVDEYVTGLVREWGGDATVETTGDDTAAFRAADVRIAEAERALDDYMAAFVPVVGVKRAQAHAERLQAEVDAAVAAREQLAATRVVAGAQLRAAEVLDGDDVEEKRHLLGAAIEHVTVKKTSPTAAGGRPRLPVAERVEVVWRRD